MKKSLCFIIIAMMMTACSNIPSAEWIEGEKLDNGTALNTLVLKNMPEGSRVWFQELYDVKTIVEGPKMNHYQGTAWYIDIPTSGNITIKYYGRPLPRHSWAPESFILQQKGKNDIPMKANYHFLDFDKNDKKYGSNYEVQSTDIIPQIKQNNAESHPNGWYRITITEDGNTTIEADDEDGAFYAKTTLEKLPKPLKPMVLEDWPDYQYRGFMLDVARDFRSVDEVLKVLDLMASWKLNTLHFHIGDDESWCLEINDLPDLTEFGGRHALPDWDLKETVALQPQANGIVGKKMFYTGEEYKQILRYAWERRIAVIPEFDSPGHSRASIKAMQAYERRTGDDSYRLQDPADTSHYWSAQDFTDNVLSVDLEGVYKFYGKVFDDVIRLHREAEVPLRAIHIGGDEVPEGAWSGHDRRAMKEYFTRRMLDLAEERGIKLAGWEDIAHGLEPETEARLKKSLYFLNVWNTNGIEGYPVVLSPADYTYLDLAYSDAKDEPGLAWAGYVDEHQTFSLQPDNYKGDIIGVQAQLWAAQLRSFDDLTYQMLPKALGVAERAWNKKHSDFGKFYNIIKEKEMPVWEEKRYTFKKREPLQNALITRTELYHPGDYGSANYRIPAVITAKDGSLVAVTDKRKNNDLDLPQDIDIVCNRSTHGGRTWSEPVTIAQGTGVNHGFGDCAIAQSNDDNGLIAVFVGGPGLWNSTPSNPIRSYKSYSYDNGQTWTAPEDITHFIFGDGCIVPEHRTWQASFFASGNGLRTSTGRIMFVAAVREDETWSLNNYAVYSDDNGLTWKMSGRASVGGDEAKVIELIDGRILMSIRHNGKRWFNISEDGGETWQPTTSEWDDIIAPACNGDMIRYSSNILLHSAPSGSERSNVTVYLSYDEGKTWPVSKVIVPYSSAYSSLCILPDGTIGLYVEESPENTTIYNMVFYNFSIE